MRNRFLISILLFGSGFCALIYQMAWIRQLRSVFGVTTQASAAVLAIFMGGLGFGGLLLGRRVEKNSRPLNYYANLEIIIALSAAATPFLILLIRSIYFELGGVQALGNFWAAVIRLALSTLVLGVSVFCMGGTLPAAARAITSHEDISRRGLGVIYGINTLGAMAGVAFASFIAFEIFGVRTTLYFAVLINLVIAISARALSRRQIDAPTIDSSPAESASKAPAKEGTSAVSSKEYPVLIAAFITGFAFMGAEIVWYRMSASILGGTVYSLALILFWALAGIGLGGLVYSIGGEKKQPGYDLFVITLALEGLLMLIPYAMGDYFAYGIAIASDYGNLGFFYKVSIWSAAAAIMVFPTALIAGYQFPLLIAIKGSGKSGVANDVGSIYASNTLGSIIGSISAGFGLMPLLTAGGLWKILCLLLPIAAFPFFLTHKTKSLTRRASIIAFASIVLVMVLLSQAEGPTNFWRHVSIGAERFSTEYHGINQFKDRNYMRQFVFETWEGIEFSVAANGIDGIAHITNGKSDSNVYYDAPTLLGLGLYGSLIRPGLKTGFVVGLSTGVTAGWLASVPGIESVDVAEIEPDVAKLTEMCSAANLNVLKNPKVNIHLADAREFLQTSEKIYDLIISEPSNPFRVGVASLFTVDYYKEIRDHLNDNGLLIQWVQAYEITPEALRIILASVKEVFEYAVLWRIAGAADYIISASNQPIVIDRAHVASMLDIEPFKTAMKKVSGIDSANSLLGQHVATTELFSDAHLKSEGFLNTDDRLLLEFWMARAIGLVAQNPLDEEVARYSKKIGANLPAVKVPLSEEDSKYIEGLSQQFTDAGANELKLSWSSQKTSRQASIADFESEQNKELALLRYAINNKLIAAGPALLLANKLISKRLSVEDGAILFDILQPISDSGYEAEVKILKALHDRAATGSVQVELIVDVLSAIRADVWADQKLVRPFLEMLEKLNFSKPDALALIGELKKGPFPINRNEELRFTLLFLLTKNISLNFEDFGPCAEFFEANSDKLIWREKYLIQRLACLAKNRSPQAQKAKEDYIRFVSQRPLTVDEVMQ